MTLVADHPHYMEIEEAIDWPAQDWKGQCFTVACEIVNAGIVDGVAEYGLYLGPVAPDTYFNHRRPAQKHGWIRRPDGSIIDPTRWVFEGHRPYIALIPADAEEQQAEYDLGGERFRREAFGDDQPPPHTGQGREFDNDTLMLSDNVYSDVTLLIGQPPWDTAQMHWLAHRLPEELGPNVKEIYAGLIRAGALAMVPLDFQIKVWGRDLEKVIEEIRSNL